MYQLALAIVFIILAVTNIVISDKMVGYFIETGLEPNHLLPQSIALFVGMVLVAVLSYRKERS